MKTVPAVSVVTASYNVANYVGQAIHSALSQTFRDFELIVLDDGSTDATLDVIRNISDPRIRIEPRLHQGASAGLADGVALARAPYLAFLDGDDFWNPNKLEQHVRVLDSEPAVDLTFSWSRIVDEFGRDTGLDVAFVEGIHHMRAIAGGQRDWQWFLACLPARSSSRRGWDRSNIAGVL